MLLGMAGLCLRQKRGDDWWFARFPNALQVSDFSNDRYMRDGVDALAASNFGCVRSSGHSDYALGVTNEFEPFADGTPRTTGNGVLAEAVGNRVTNFPHTPSTNGALVMAGGVAAPGVFLGIFSDAMRVSSNGENWHRLILGGANFAATTGVPYGFVAFYQAGTSGRVRVVLRDETGAVDSSCSGPVGAVSVEGDWAGVISHLSEVLIADGVYMLRGIITPNATSGYSIAVGPDSTVIGEDVVVIAGWVEDTFPSSPILFNPAGTSARAADVVSDPAPADWLADAITVVLETDEINIPAGGEGFLFSLSDGSLTNCIELKIDGTGMLAGRVNDIGIGAQLIFGTQAANDGLLHKIALSWDRATGGVALSLDGGLPEEVTAKNVPAAAALGQMNLLSSFGGTLQPNGVCRCFAVLPGFRTGSALQALTS